MMKYKAILFDMDGTVLDTLGDLYDSINHALKNFSLPETTLTQAKAALGNGAEYLIRHVVPADASEELTIKVLEFYKPWYEQHCQIKTKPYDGIVQMMADLKSAGYETAIVSNKPDPAVKELGAKFYPGIFAIGESPEIRRKPWPDMPTAVAKRLGLSNSECLYVGDSEVDILTAKNSGMDCVAVSWGFRTREQLIEAGAERIADTVGELAAMLM